jgi:hypothetical protein
VVTNNTIDSNIASRTTIGGEGGGIFVLNNTRQTFLLDSNLIYNNSANGNGVGSSNGGGVAIQWAHAFTLTNNIIASNHANNWGSGIYIYGMQGVPFAGQLLHNTIAANIGAGTGLHVLGGVYISGERDAGTIELTNNIIALHNTAIRLQTQTNITATILAHYTMWDGSGSYTQVTGSGNGYIFTDNDIIGNPAFVGGNDYHVLPASVALDAGVDTTVQYDFDGDSRPSDSGVDIGADEMWTSLTVNHPRGAPGSYLTFEGNNFPPNQLATISVNGVTVGTVSTDANGDLIFLLTTASADEGVYGIMVSVNPNASTRFVLDVTEPIWPQEDSGSIFDVPAGIALDDVAFLPLIVRKP